MSHFPAKVDVNAKRRQNRILAKYKYGLISDHHDSDDHHVDQSSVDNCLVTPDVLADNNTGNKYDVVPSETTTESSKISAESLLKIKIENDIREDVLNIRHDRIRKGFELFYSLTDVNYRVSDGRINDAVATVADDDVRQHETSTACGLWSPSSITSSSGASVSPTPFDGYDEDYVIRILRPLILSEEISSDDEDLDDSKDESEDDDDDDVTRDDSNHDDHVAGPSTSKKSSSKSRRNSISINQQQKSSSSSKAMGSSSQVKRRTSGGSSSTGVNKSHQKPDLIPDNDEHKDHVKHDYDEPHETKDGKDYIQINCIKTCHLMMY